MDGETRNPNHLLRRQRELRGWSQARLAEELLNCCEEDPRPSARGEINAKMIGAWERGEHVPSPYYQEKLRLLFGKSAEELGFIEPLQPPEHAPVVVPSSVPQVLPALVTLHQAIDLLCEASDASIEQQSGAWLALGAGNLAPLFAFGWSLEDVFTSLHVLLKGVQAMSTFSRRTFIQLGAAAVVSSVPIPEGKHISAEDRAKLQSALSESIAAGWKLFHTAGNVQVFAVGQAQLYLVQQSHALLSSRVRAGFYTSVYNLMGKALHFQERYQDALDAHINAHVAAMSTGDPWNIIQSLICQADSHQALGQHIQAIETIEEALRLVGNPIDEEHIRTKAHLLACWADNAMTMEEYTVAQKKLEESATYLSQISPKEEFDRTSWLQLAGKCALATGDHETAIRYYTEALVDLPPNWLIRQAFIVTPLMVAFACAQDRKTSLEMAEKAASVMSTLNAPIINKQFAASVQLGLLGAFPHDVQVRKFVDGLPRRLPSLNVTAGKGQ